MTHCANTKAPPSQTPLDWAQPFQRLNVPGVALSHGTVETQQLDFFGHAEAPTDNTIKVDAHTIFEAGSLSKTVAAYLIYLLEQLAHITPHTPLYDQLATPSQRAHLLEDLHEPQAHARAQKITAEMALTHTSGFQGWRAHLPLTIPFEPGSRFAYSGEGYLLLQRFLEIKLDTPIEQLFRHYVFGPLGLQDSSFSCPQGTRHTIAIGHNRHGMPVPKFRQPKPVIAGSLHTSLRDYTRFTNHILTRHGDDQAKGKDSFIDWVQQTTTNTPVKGITWGKGWGLLSADRPSASPVVWHWGDTGGYHSFILIDLHAKQFVNYFTNSQHGLTPLATLLQQLKIPVTRAQTEHFIALIDTVTHRNVGLERYWFDYDTPEPFYQRVEA